MLLVTVSMTARSASKELFPKPIFSQLPMYPELARRAHVAGTVRLWFVVNGNGEVVEVQSISGNPMLRDDAVGVVRTWRFPANSIASNVRHETEFVYVLNAQLNEGEPKLTVSMADFRQIEIVSEVHVDVIE